MFICRSTAWRKNMNISSCVLHWCHNQFNGGYRSNQINYSVFSWQKGVFESREKNSADSLGLAFMWWCTHNRLAFIQICWKHNHYKRLDSLIKSSIWKSESDYVIVLWITYYNSTRALLKDYRARNLPDLPFFHDQHYAEEDDDKEEDARDDSGDFHRVVCWFAWLHLIGFPGRGPWNRVTL